MARRSARQVGWGIADQALSSVTNFALAVIVARNVDPSDFGAFTLAFAVYTMALTVGRPLSVDAVTIHYSTDDTDVWRRAVRSATGTIVLLGAIVGGVLVVVGVLPALGDDVRLLAVLGLGLPGLLLQDAWRFCFFASSRGSAAFWNDAVWAVCMFGLIVPAALGGHLTDERAVACWCVGALVAAMVGMFQARVVPDPRHVLRWWSEHRALVPRLTAEAAVTGAGTPALLFFVGMVGGLPAAGALRAGQILMNALNVIDHGFQISAVPTASRLARRSPDLMLRFCIGASVGLGVLALAWTGLLLLLPASWGEAILGETWDQARSVILPLGITAVLSGLQTGALVGLRARALARRSLRARAAGDTIELGTGVTGALVDSSTGAAWGLAVGKALSTTIWWAALVRGGAWRMEVLPTDGVGVTTVDDEVIAFDDVDDDAPVTGRGP